MRGGANDEGGAPIPTDGTTFALLNTFGGQADLISFAYTHDTVVLAESEGCGLGCREDGAWRGTELSAVVGHIEQQRRRLVGAQVGWSATDAAISSSTATRGQEVVITVVSCDDYMVDWRASFVGGVPTGTSAHPAPTR